MYTLYIKQYTIYIVYIYIHIIYIVYIYIHYIYIYYYIYTIYIPVVPHKAVAEVSKIGNL